MKAHLVKKSNAFLAVCGQDAPKHSTVKKAKVTCGSCKRTKAYRG